MNSAASALDYWWSGRIGCRDDNRSVGFTVKVQEMESSRVFTRRQQNACSGDSFRYGSPEFDCVTHWDIGANQFRGTRQSQEQLRSVHVTITCSGCGILTCALVFSARRAATNE